MWWPKIYDDVKDIVSKCPNCQNYRINYQLHEKLHPLLPPVEPIEHWGIDFIGRLSTTQSHAAKSTAARALGEATTENMANFIYEEIVIQLGLSFFVPGLPDIQPSDGMLGIGSI
ncbi:unnamed protein product [Didymodactylos carnosus]|uniref:Integrase zinc-binding domain-containing protein n=1 Tax=Didymodactylos carnosus TaxID=1234261 RepID=A0A814R1S0_9BILA|nr:unnamed protein product [Didymodactylos carnosus]CAF1128046.1 unnamed protein product [Didymodactylos carnosus]CAF3833984.1 unnamed protein product [Didymodactylos carnosus]CAF3891551.1 unnamed protein product [Didymodactylos carnosus]